MTSLTSLVGKQAVQLYIENDATHEETLEARPFNDSEILKTLISRECLSSINCTCFFFRLGTVIRIFYLLLPSIIFSSLLDCNYTIVGVGYHMLLALRKAVCEALAPLSSAR